MSYTYINLEDAIYKAWQTSDDLEMFYKHHGDHPEPMTEDEISNMIYGIKQLHDMRMEALMDMMCRVHKLNQYTTDPEVLAKREKVFNDAVEAGKQMSKQLKKGKKK
jgi:benzoyl-CoA reductase/2-hydroxyglutaryl-CoA dehydratase subunit BcrC/BadD/HgdB